MTTHAKSSGALAACLCAIVAAGCAGRDDTIDQMFADTPPVDLTDPAAVATAAQYSHPVHSVLYPVVLYAFADELAREGSCPRVIDRSDRAAGIVDRVYIGDGCTTTIDDHDDDVTLRGAIAVQGDATGTRIQYLDFRWETTVECAVDDAVSAPIRANASIAITGRASVPFLLVDEIEPSEGLLAPGHYAARFELDGTEPDEQCVPVTASMAYDYVFSASAERGRTTFDAVGRAAFADRAGKPSDLPRGAWRVTIDGLVFEDDSTCREPLAGTMTLEAGDHEAEILGDGETSCTPDECAPWRLDGAPRADEICDLVPSVAGGCSASGAGSGWNALMLLAALALLVRRRRTAAHRLREPTVIDTPGIDTMFTTG